MLDPSLAEAYITGAQLHKESFVREHASQAQAPVDVIVRKGAGEDEAPVVSGPLPGQFDQRLFGAFVATGLGTEGDQDDLSRAGLFREGIPIGGIDG